MSAALSETLQLTAGLHTPHGPGSIRENQIIHSEVGNPSEQVWGISVSGVTVAADWERNSSTLSKTMCHRADEAL